MTDGATPAPAPAAPRIHRLGTLDYAEALTRMRDFTAARAADRDRPVDDEIWLTAHPPVYTLGLDGNRSHLLAPGEIPVVATERGGQVTFHGPGQLIAYILVDLRRRKIGVRTLVERIESGVIAALAGAGVAAHRIDGAPGLYVGGAAAAGQGAATPAPVTPDIPRTTARARNRPPAFGEARKIASIGLKVSHGFSYHGVAVNGRMDLTPFERIDPCGYPGLRMTDVAREASADFPFDHHAFADRLGIALVTAIQG